MRNNGIEINIRLKNTGKYDIFVADIPSDRIKISVTNPSGKVKEFDSEYKYLNVSPTIYKKEAIKIKPSEVVTKKLDFLNIYRKENSSPLIPQAQRIVFDKNGTYKIILKILNMSISEVIWKSKPLKVDWTN